MNKAVMKTYTILFLKVFAYIFVVLSIFQVINTLLWKESNFGFYVIFNLITAVASTLVILWIYRTNYKSIGIDSPSMTDIQTNQKMEVKSNITPENLIKSMKNHSFTNHWSVNNRDGEMEIYSKESLMSLGNDINVKYSPIEDDFYLYDIQSKPKNKLAFLDYGNNLKNVFYIKKYLQPNG